MAKLPAPGTDPYNYPGHGGIDVLRGTRGVPILASGPGVVLRTSRNAAGGHWTVVRYDGWPHEIGYAHQDKVPPVKAGQRIEEGSLLGYVGATGTRVTGPHLHMEDLATHSPASILAMFDFTRKAATAAARTVTVSRDVAAIQRLVGAAPDGVYGPDTRAKVKAWQAAHGLAADGIWGPRSDAKGFPKPAAPAAKPSGPVTYASIQRGLNKFGYRLAVDGIWGKKSSAALADFQRKHGLKVDRIVGPKTRAALGI